MMNEPTHEFVSDDPQADELAALKARLEAEKFMPERGGADDFAPVELGGTATAQVVETGTGPVYDEPEGGYRPAVTTQPDYAAFARDATTVATNTRGLGSTGDLGSARPRDDKGQDAKHPPIVYGQAPVVPEGTRVIEAQQ